MGPQQFVQRVLQKYPMGTDVAFVATASGGYALGVAVRNEQGYYPVPLSVYETFDAAFKSAAYYNQNVLGLTQDEADEIIASSMQVRTD